MSSKLKVLLGVIGWLVVVTLLHLWLNTHALDFASGNKPQTGVRFQVGFLPVT